MGRGRVFKVLRNGERCIMKYQQTLLSGKVLSDMKEFLKHPHVGSDNLMPFNGTLKYASIRIRNTDAGGLFVTASWDGDTEWVGSYRDNQKTFRRKPGYSERSLMNLSVQVFEFLNNRMQEVTSANALHRVVELMDADFKNRLCKTVDDMGICTTYAHMSVEDSEKILQIASEMG